MASGIYQSANPNSNARELAYQFKLTTPHFILASQETLVCALEAAEMVGIGRERVYVFNHAPLAKDGSGNDDSKTGVKHWKNLLASTEIGRSFYWKRLTPSESKLTTVYMIMTSGTTGLPKAAEVSHYGILANCVQTDFDMSLEPNLRTKELAAKNSRWLCTIPLYHGLALLAMTKDPAVKSGKYDLSSVTKTFSCAAPLGPEPTFQYESLWPEGQVNIKQGLASTDLKSMPLLTSPVDPAVIRSAGSVGEPMPNCEIRLMDDDENEVEPGQSGEIWFRGPNLMKGQGMWPARMRMGGITSWTERRQVTVDEGLKPMRADILWQEMIKFKGVQVWRAELEALLLDHPAVRDAAVIGVRKDHEEHPRAYIVAAPETFVTSDDILQFVNNRVSTIKRLTGGVVFTNTIRRSPSGKILRRIIRDTIKNESKL
ncbi:putative AMP dependent CoA ligase [Aspergillus flavus AF70]|nr:putative AMP dependent CoA ligase [Aspergillus flavus AF70]